MGLVINFIAQVATAAALQAPPDVEIRAKVRAERVEIKQEGKAQIALRVNPGVGEPARVERTAPPGQSRYRDLAIDVEGTVHITAPNETLGQPQIDNRTGNPE